VHEQIFISGVWHSGTSLIAEIAKMNGYNLGKATNSRNDNNFAWRGPLNSLGSPSGAFAKDYDPDSVKGILEKSWPFDTVDEEENKLFEANILKSRRYSDTVPFCCKLPGFSLMTPHIQRAFPSAPIIHVIRNPVDVSQSPTDNYFLRRLILDKTNRELKDWEIQVDSVIVYLFTALGGLEWTKIKFNLTNFVVDKNRRIIYWNMLYTLRWILIMDRLRLDLDAHDIKNHHIIKFEKIVLGDKEETERLKDILKIKGQMKMPKIDRSKAFKYESFINSLPSEYSSSRERLGMIYHMSLPYLKSSCYQETIDFFEQLKAAGKI